jgi:hypothetical protein
MILKASTYRLEQKWKIIGQPLDITDESFVAGGKVVSMYRCSWTASLSCKHLFYYIGQDNSRLDATYTDKGQGEESTVLVIEINQGRYTLTTPVGLSFKVRHLEWFERDGENVGKIDVTAPAECFQKVIKGQLNRPGLLITGEKGSVLHSKESMEKNVINNDVLFEARYEETIKWQLRRKKGEPKKEVPIKKPPKKPGRLKPMPP